MLLGEDRPETDIENESQSIDQPERDETGPDVDRLDPERAPQPGGDTTEDATLAVAVQFEARFGGRGGFHGPMIPWRTMRRQWVITLGTWLRG